MKKYFGLFLTISLSIFFIGYQFGHVLFSPNTYMFGNTGDAIKNYYTFSYYITNNQSLSNFEGMNYPFGESVFYTDGHPLLSLVLKEFKSIFPSIESNSVGILNILMLCSIPLSALFLYLIFKRWKLNNLLSVSGAIAITILSPQIIRMGGHYALAYVCAIPMTIWLSFRFLDEAKLKWGFLLLGNLLFWLFTHAYLGAICTGFVLSLAICTLCFKCYRALPNYKIIFSRLLIVGSCALLVFYLTVKLLDTHEFRNEDPMGIWNSTTTLRSLFLPYHGPIGEKLFSMGMKDKSNEGANYIGIFVGIFILFVLPLIWIKEYKKNKGELQAEFPSRISECALLFISTIPLLLLSMLVPFRFGLEELLDQLSFIKQFRAIGRFAWPFYFASGMFFIYGMWHFYESVKTGFKRTLIASSVILMLGYQTYEAFANQNYLREQSSSSRNLFNPECLEPDFSELVEVLKANKDSTQGVIPLPFFYIGSEHFNKGSNSKVYRLNQVLSYHSSLPLVSAYLTRTSMKESKKIFQIFTEGIYERAWFKDLPSDKPFLIVRAKGEPLTTREENLILRGELIRSSPIADIYRITIADLLNSELLEEIIQKFESDKQTFFSSNGFLVNDTLDFVIFESFDEDIGKYPEGVFQGTLMKSNIVVDSHLPNCLVDSTYTCSFWIGNNGENYGQGKLKSFAYIQEYVGDSIVSESSIAQLSESLCIDGDRSLIELQFQRKRSLSNIRLIVKGHKAYNKTIQIDDLLIAKEGSDLYKEYIEFGKFKLFWNNHSVLLH